MTFDDRARELRLAFDASFAEAPPAQRPDRVELLVIRAGEQRLALRLDGLRGLFVDKVMTPVPSPVAELIGLAAFRGDVAPVYDLGALLGAGEARDPLRYVVLVTHAGALVGFAFTAFDGHVRVAPEDVAAAAAGGPALPEVVRHDGASRPVVDVAALLASLGKRAAGIEAATGKG
ncbi:MAG: chemotaxis protein CheW [Labilithrix sp.]|nr:chemotaxis protein CheW [Labilithrix sp.]